MLLIGTALRIERLSAVRHIKTAPSQHALKNGIARKQQPLLVQFESDMTIAEVISRLQQGQWR